LFSRNALIPAAETGHRQTGRVVAIFANGSDAPGSGRFKPVAAPGHAWRGPFSWIARHAAASAPRMSLARLVELPVSLDQTGFQRPSRLQRRRPQGKGNGRSGTIRIEAADDVCRSGRMKSLSGRPIISPIE